MPTIEKSIEMAKLRAKELQEKQFKKDYVESCRQRDNAERAETDARDIAKHILSQWEDLAEEGLGEVRAEPGWVWDWAYFTYKVRFATYEPRRGGWLVSSKIGEIKYGYECWDWDLLIKMTERIFQPLGWDIIQVKRIYGDGMVQIVLGKKGSIFPWFPRFKRGKGKQSGRM